VNDDLVERLRLGAHPQEITSVWNLTVVRYSLLNEAADEIERLRRIADWFVEDRDDDFIDVTDREYREHHGGPWIAYDGMGVNKVIPDEVIDAFRWWRIQQKRAKA
jgi:hypothetical protein